MYWSGWNLTGIRRTRVSSSNVGMTSSIETIGSSVLFGLGDIIYFGNEDTQPPGKKLVDGKRKTLKEKIFYHVSVFIVSTVCFNSPCSDLCIPTPDGAFCACSDNFDGSTRAPGDGVSCSGSILIMLSFLCISECQK